MTPDTADPTSPGAPYELLDDGFAPPPCDLMVVGCGSILRGDDAVGPVLVRTLFAEGVPDGVRLIDGGTAGMDVAFGMRGAARVVIVDASRTGAAPGTVYRVPARELADLPPVDGLHSHNFRWDHALSFSSWLLGPARPSDVTVYLVEGASYEPGAALTEAVQRGMEQVVALLRRDHFPPEAPPEDRPEDTVEITELGYLHVPQALAEGRFPTDVCLASRDGDTLWLLPVHSADNGGLVLKQRNAAGDRSLLLAEVLGFEPVAGTFVVHWDDARAALRVDLRGATDGATGPGGGDVPGAAGARGPHGGLVGAGAVGGPPRGDDAHGGGPAARGDLLHEGAGAAGGRRDQQDGGATTPVAPRAVGDTR